MRWMLFLMMALTSLAAAQVFAPATEPVPAFGVPGPRPARSSVVHVDVGGLRAQLDGAPQWDSFRPLFEYGLPISLPHPDGSLTPCYIAESPVMEAPLAARYPSIKTYLVETADGVASGRVELAPRGLTGMIRMKSQSDSRAWIIDPWQSRDPNHVVAYWLSDLPSAYGPCHLPGEENPVTDFESHPYGDRAVVTLRRFRMALACTGEYGLHQCDMQGNPPNIVDPLAAIVTAISRANVVFEQDLAIHFDLVLNNDLLIFTDPATDPYASCDGVSDTNCFINLVDRNPEIINGIIGNANYDIGHVMARAVGGGAYRDCVCGVEKARGATGIAYGGDLEVYSAGILLHQLGHQFGGEHTFSGTRGLCASNLLLSTAFEAGSGSSIMGFAGACPVGDEQPSDNIVQSPDPFFNISTVSDINVLVGSPACFVVQTTSNHVPVISSISISRTIPVGTPFMLEASATDEDAEDVLTYSWEQYDNGVARPLSGAGSVDNGTGSLFRIFPPTSDNWRMFPRKADILSGTPTPGEQLPSVGARNRRFRVIVRDNHAGAGATATSGIVTLTVANNTSPFVVTSPAAGESFPAGASTSVVWLVGGTNVGPIACASVTISVSVDGGDTFTPIGNFPNSGTASITLPNTPTSDARIMVRAVGNHFFNISPRFEIFFPCIADFNVDGGIDGDDVIAFFSAWNAGVQSADFDRDANIDGDDVIAFFGAWDAGC